MGLSYSWGSDVSHKVLFIPWPILDEASGIDVSGFIPDSWGPEFSLCVRKPGGFYSIGQKNRRIGIYWENPVQLSRFNPSVLLSHLHVDHRTCFRMGGTFPLAPFQNATCSWYFSHLHVLDVCLCSRFTWPVDIWISVLVYPSCGGYA